MLLQRNKICLNLIWTKKWKNKVVWSTPVRFSRIPLLTSVHLGGTKYWLYCFSVSVVLSFIHSLACSQRVTWKINTELSPLKLHFFFPTSIRKATEISFLYLLSTGGRHFTSIPLPIIFRQQLLLPTLYKRKESFAFFNTQARIHASASIAPSCLVLSSIAPSHGRTCSRKIFIVSMVAILLITPTQRAAMCLTAVLGCWRHM